MLIIGKYLWHCDFEDQLVASVYNPEWSKDSIEYHQELGGPNHVESDQTVSNKFRSYYSNVIIVFFYEEKINAGTVIMELIMDAAPWAQN